MVEVPKELQKFNIRVICCGTQPNTHEWLIRKVADQIFKGGDTNENKME